MSAGINDRRDVYRVLLIRLGFYREYHHWSDRDNPHGDLLGQRGPMGHFGHDDACTRAYIAAH